MNCKGFCSPSWTQVSEISGTKLLISLNHCSESANIEVFDLANKGRAEKIYSFDEVIGCKYTILNYSNSFTTNLLNIDIKNNNFQFEIDTGWSNLNLQHEEESLLGVINLSGKIACHLFSVDTHYVNIKESLKLIRKSRWHSQYSNEDGRFD